MQGSFWTAFGMRFGGGGGGGVGGIDEVLELENCKLEDLLDHDEVIQECKYMNAQLIEFLSQRDVVEKLIRYVIALPPNEDPHSTASASTTATTTPTSDSENPQISSSENASNNTASHANSATSTNEEDSNSNMMMINPSHNPPQHDATQASNTNTNTNTLKASTDETPSTANETENSIPLPIAPVPINLLSIRTNASKYPYIASELFACEVVSMLDVMFEDVQLLELLFSFLSQPAPIEPSAAAYFRKVVVVLIQRKYEQLVKYIASNNLIERLVTHIGLYSVMELLIMIGWDDGLGQLADTDWLSTQNLVPKLVDKLAPQFEPMPDVHMNAARALVDVVVKCPPAAKSNLVSNLQSTQVLEEIFKHMFSGSLSSLTHSMSIIIVLVQRYANRRSELSDEHIGEGDSQKNELGELIEEPFLSLLPHLNTIINLLSDCSSTPEVATQFGRSIPFGETRMKVVELCLVLLRSRVPAIDRALIELKVLPLLIDAFFQYPWNNMLHGLVESIIRTVLESESDSLKKALFEDGALVDKFIAAYDRNEEIVAAIAASEDGMSGPSGHFRQGYMGHLIRTSLAIEETCKKHEVIRMQLLGASAAKWVAFVSTKLEQENERQKAAAGFNNDEDLLDALQFDTANHTGYAMGGVADSSKEDSEDADPYQFNEEHDDNDSQHLGYDYGSHDADADSWRDTDMGVQYQEWSDFSQAFSQATATASASGSAGFDDSHTSTDTHSSNASSSSSDHDDFSRGVTTSNRSIIEFAHTSNSTNDSDDDSSEDHDHDSHHHSAEAVNQAFATAGAANASNSSSSSSSSADNDDFEVHFPSADQAP